MGFGNIFKKAVSLMILEELEKESKAKRKAKEEIKTTSVPLGPVERMISKVEGMHLTGYYYGMPEDELKHLCWECRVMLGFLKRCKEDELPEALYDRWYDAVAKLEFEISAMECYLQDYKT